MISFPNLPTDNLYKFVFVSGLTIVFMSVVLFVTQYNKLSDELTLLELDQVKLKQESSFIEQDIIELEKSVVQKTDSSKSLVAVLEYKQKIKQLKMNFAILGVKQKQINQEFREFTFLLIYVIAFSLFGLILARKGYNDWYKMVQYPID